MEIIYNHPEKLTLPGTTLGLIGDLDGKFDNLERHLRYLNLIEKRGFWDELKKRSLKWNGGDTQLVLSGDILADRNTDGFKIILVLSKLKKQAEFAGGSIEILAGNHEEWMIGFLMGMYPTISSGIKKQHLGMLELKKFGNRKEEILPKMRDSKEGKVILEEICAMKLIILKGNTIHSHTPLSGAMLDTLGHYYRANDDNMTRAIEYINTTWQGILKRVLFDKNLGTKEYETLLIKYELMAKTFLHPLNGTAESLVRRGGNLVRHEKNIAPIDHPTYTLFREKAGVDTICHGHTDDKIEIPRFNIINLNKKSEQINTKSNDTMNRLQENTRTRAELVMSK